MIVEISGIDGSGKSTQIEKIVGGSLNMVLGLIWRNYKPSSRRPFVKRLFNHKRKDELQDLDQTKLVKSTKYLNALTIL